MAKSATLKPKTTKTPTPAAPPPDAPAAAQRLLTALERERAGRTLYLGTAVKAMTATKDLLAAGPEVHVEFVRLVVATYAKMGTKKGEWFRDPAAPAGGAEAVRLLLRRKLPFTDDMLAEMFEQMAKVNYLPLVQFNEQLAMALEKHAAAAAAPSPRLRTAAKAFADVLAVRHVPAAEARKWRENWNFPSPTDRKTAARIDTLFP